MALTEAQAAQVRTQEAYDNSQAALESMKRKLAVRVLSGLTWSGLSACRHSLTALQPPATGL